MQGSKTGALGDMTKKRMQDPSVDTTWLPDKYLEKEKERLRESLRDEWLAAQDVVK
jgi:protein FAM50